MPKGRNSRQKDLQLYEKRQANLSEITKAGLETMSKEDKIKNAVDDTTGKVKEAVGEVTGDDKLHAEGKTDQVKANLKPAGEKVKDAFKH